MIHASSEALKRIVESDERDLTEAQRQKRREIDEIVSTLVGLGHEELKLMSSTSVAILTDGNRMRVLEDVQGDLDGAEFDASIRGSSIGGVRYGKYVVIAKSIAQQGKRSPGIDNEEAFLANMQRLITSPTNVVFTDGSKLVVISGVTDARHVASDTANRKKADAMLSTVDGRDIPVSIKKDNADMWESVDVYWGKQAKEVLDREQLAGNIDLTFDGVVYIVSRNLAVRALPEEAIDVVFGSDLLPNSGFVLVKTFNRTDFTRNGDELQVRVSKIVDSPDDLRDDLEIYFVIRNDRSRNCLNLYRGIRPLAIQRSRVTRNTLVVDR